MKSFISPVQKECQNTPFDYDKNTQKICFVLIILFNFAYV